MKNFIIIYESRINGDTKVTYHSDIYENKNKETMNVYGEELTTHRKEARIFFDAKEALKIATMFKNKFHKPAVSRLLALIIIISLSVTSCSKNGYGCHGNGKYITRVR